METKQKERCPAFSMAKVRPAHSKIKNAVITEGEWYRKQAEGSFAYVRELRRYFHQNPEQVMKEEQTSRRICKELDQMGISYMIVPPYGVVGVIDGKLPGRTVALRADMDALPIQELGNPPYKSQKDGCMHACGHDCHMSMLLGAAKILSENTDRLHGRVKLIFQEAEEIGEGALLMMKAGMLDDCSAIFGFHQSAEFPTGTFLMQEGDFTAANVIFVVNITGGGGHGSQPHLSRDPVVAASAMIQSLQTIVSRETDPEEMAVVTVGYINSSTSRCNIITEGVEFGGTIRYRNSELKDVFEQDFYRILKNIGAAYEVNVEIEYHNVCIPVYNDPALTEFTRQVLEALAGKEQVNDRMKTAAAEDFAFYQQQLPGMYFFMGSGDEEYTKPLHNPYYDIDEKALIEGTAAYTKLAVDYLLSTKEQEYERKGKKLVETDCTEEESDCRMS